MRSSRMSLGFSLPATSTRSSLIWPTRGSMRNGECYPPLESEPLTSGGASGLWPTPTTGDAKAAGSRNTPGSKAHPGISLTDAVRGDGGKGRLFPTPHRNCSTGPGSQGRDGGENLQTQVGGSLNPPWVEWLMGWPIGWTDLQPLAMDRFREWSGLHGECSDEEGPADAV